MAPRDFQPSRMEADTVGLLFTQTLRTRSAWAFLVLFVWRRTQRSRPPGADRYCAGAAGAAGAVAAGAAG